MSLIYSTKDEEDLMKNLDEICTAQRELELTENPTKKEREAIHSDIIDFIIERKRTVYGGYALHQLIVDGSKGKDRIYHDLAFPDIEFYTSELKDDARDLADRLAEKYKHVSAEEGMHPGTFKIFVEFQDFCDISYLPKMFLDTIPTMKTSRGFSVITPEFAMIDIFRVYVYPVNNYYRLTKSFRRSNKLLKYHSLKFERHPVTSKPAPQLDVKMFTRRPSVVVTGSMAYNYYCEQAKLSDLAVPVSFISVVSTSYDDDVSHYTQKFSEKREYLPFLELTCRHTDFYANGRLVLRIWEERDKCIPYADIPNNMRITPFQGTFYYSLIEYFKAIFDRNEEHQKENETILNGLIECKKRFYKDNPSVSVISTGPFQEFVVTCVGQFLSEKRKSRLLRTERKKNKRPIVYRYNPGENNNGFEVMRVTLSLGERDYGHKKKRRRRGRRSA